MTAKEKKRQVPFGRLSLSAVGLVLFLTLVGGIVAGCGVVASAPDVSNLDWDTSTVIYDRNGKEAYRLHSGENRTPVKLTAVPKPVREAFVAIEDPSFFEHKGLNPRGIARAVWRSALYFLDLPGGRLEGGSTITQQLARQAWLNSQDITVKRKLQEAWVAVQLERHYTKNEILEMYLNEVYFGHGAYGIDAAAKTFFAKEIKDLTIAEAAQLAGMINGPSYFDPYEHPEGSLKRRDLVLSAMLKEGFVDEAQYQKAKADEPKLGSIKQADGTQTNHFTDHVINILHNAKPGLAEKYGIDLSNVESVAKAGLKVYTTMDPKLQALAEQAVADQMAQADKEYGLSGKSPRPEAALVAMNPKTGEVLAMVGGRDRQGMLEFNRATAALRQPGSAIKPFVAYMPALEAGLSPATILDDAPVMLTTDKKTVWPQNYDFKYLGLKPMRYGVEQSVNPMAVRAMQAAGGPAKGGEMARRFGLSTITKEDEHLALALGGVSGGTTVLDMTAAYGALANMGTRVEPVVVKQIVDRHGEVLFEAHPQKTAVVKPGIAYLMIDMMKDVVKKGTAYGFTGGFKGWPAAGKTGTTEDNRDGWFVGFTPDLVVTVWNGYDNPDNHLKWTAAFVPVKTWNQFMTQAVTERPADWPRPADVVSASVCRQTGMQPSELCTKDQVGTELFLKGTEPKGAGNLLVKVKAVKTVVQNPDQKTTSTQWQLWQPGCPGTPEERVFIKRPAPRVLHPTQPANPRYIPADAANEVPTVTCKPGSIWDRLFPKLPLPPGGDNSGGSQQPGTPPPVPGT